MENNKDFYVAVLKSGQHTRYGTFDLLGRVPKALVECYLKAEYRSTYKGPVNITDWYQYFFIDAENNVIPYRIGEWEVSYIGPDNGCTNFFGRDMTLHNRKNDRYYPYKSKVDYVNFVMDEINPLLNKLNGCNSEDEIIHEIQCHADYNTLETRYKSALRQLEIYREQIIAIKEIADAMLK